MSFSAPGDLDIQFGINGIITTDMRGEDDYGGYIAIQADRKIVVIGHIHDGTNDDIAVVRYNADGTLDSSFGTGGKVITDSNGNGDYAYAVAIQEDGKIVVAGNGNNGQDRDFILVRYNIDGSPDTDFGTDGIVFTDFGGSNDVAYSIAIQADGKIVAAGSSSNPNFEIIVRYNTDGSLDTDFGTNGFVPTNFGTGTYVASDLAIQTDGKILVAGYDSNGQDQDFIVVRYNTDGSPDTGFNNTGMVMTDVGGGDNLLSSMALQVDGKIIAAGLSSNGQDQDFTMVRYNNDGSLDTDFGANGIVLSDFFQDNDYANDIMVQPDGKIVIAGSSIKDTKSYFSLARYNPDGSLDIDFGTLGKAFADVSMGNYYASAAKIQPDSNILVAGRISTVQDSDLIVMRFIGEFFPIEITVGGTGNGLVTSSPIGIHCPGGCTEILDSSTIITLTATAGEWSTFTGWSGDCTGTDPTCQVTLNQAKNVTAMFDMKQVYPVTIITDGTGLGNVGVSYSVDVNSNTIITLSATAEDGSIFSGWTGDCTGTAANCEVIMDQSKNITATFDLEGGSEHSVNVFSNNGGCFLNSIL
jgi:uncharacterized delta-60 repeat protein/uncharacterized repeat protein (TIGR02543 family)